MTKSLLQILHQPFPKATKTSPNREGMTPLAGEGGAKKFLRSLTVLKHPDPYSNDDAFSAKDVKVFDRSANRFGYPYSAANDYNNQTPSRPLANPIINVNQTKAFEAVDAVGLGALVHYRVVNKLTGEYVTRQIEKTQAEEIAADLNRDFEQVLAEAHHKHKKPNVNRPGIETKGKKDPNKKHIRHYKNSVERNKALAAMKQKGRSDVAAKDE